MVLRSRRGILDLAKCVQFSGQLTTRMLLLQRMHALERPQSFREAAQLMAAKLCSLKRLQRLQVLTAWCY